MAGCYYSSFPYDDIRVCLSVSPIKKSIRSARNLLCLLWSISKTACQKTNLKRDQKILRSLTWSISKTACHKKRSQETDGIVFDELVQYFTLCPKLNPRLFEASQKQLVTNKKDHKRDQNIIRSTSKTTRNWRDRLWRLGTIFYVVPKTQPASLWSISKTVCRGWRWQKNALVRM